MDKIRSTQLCDIPKMDYVILSKAGNDILAECLEGVRRQSNVNNICIIGSDDRTKDILTRYALFGFPQTEYFVSVDSDCVLKPFWIEEMWEHMTDEIDWLAGHAILRIILNATPDKIMGHRKFSYLQTSILRTEVAKKWRLTKEDTAQYDNYVFSRFIEEKGYKCEDIAVFCLHSDSFEYGRIKEHLDYVLIEFDRNLPLKTNGIESIRTLLGGIKNFIFLRDKRIGWISFKIGLAKMTGSLILRCNR